MLQPLANCLASDDVDLLTDVCWAFAYLSDGPNERIQAVIQTGAVPNMVVFMGSSSALQLPALRTVGNIVTGDHNQTQYVLECGALRNLANLLRSHRKSLRKEACWAVSNIAAGTKSQMQALIDCNILPQVVKMLSTDEFEVRKEAAWVVSNAASTNEPEHVRFVASSEITFHQIQGCCFVWSHSAFV